MRAFGANSLRIGHLRDGPSCIRQIRDGFSKWMLILVRVAFRIKWIAFRIKWMHIQVRVISLLVMRMDVILVRVAFRIK